MSKYQQDESLLEQIKTGDQFVLKRLYKEYRESFLLYLCRRFQCDREDALEVYPWSFKIFYFNIKDNKLKLPLRSTLKTYLTSIGVNVFMKRFYRKRQNTEEINEAVMEHKVDISLIEKENIKERAELVRGLLQKIGEPCKKLLELIYLKEYSTEAVAHEMEINTEGAVRKRKFLCLKKMRKLIGS